MIARGSVPPHLTDIRLPVLLMAHAKNVFQNKNMSCWILATKHFWNSYMISMKCESVVKRISMSHNTSLSSQSSHSPSVMPSFAYLPTLRTVAFYKTRNVHKFVWYRLFTDNAFDSTGCSD